MPKLPNTLSFDDHIRRGLIEHLRTLGFTETASGHLLPPSASKDSFRSLHRLQREERLGVEKEFICRSWPALKAHFANGTDVVPAAVTPRLELVQSKSWQSDLFRLASLTWSVPVSQGYGRRLRFLVWDDSNDKLMGLIALGDPVFNMKVRDDAIGWTVRDREQRLVNVLDAYVLGAVPPYNMLLGGKVIASLLRTKDIRRAFLRKYSRSRGIISRRKKNPSLIMITTSSALGRSSVYNRLSLDGRKYLEPVGYTSGWGHFHIPTDLFQLIRSFLSAHDHRYAHNNRFGDGPNWKLRAVRHALSLLGLNENLLRHGIQREVFLCKLATNAAELLSGRQKRPTFRGLKSVLEVGGMARDRWLVPRSMRNLGYTRWNTLDLLELLGFDLSKGHRRSIYGTRQL